LDSEIVDLTEEDVLAAEIKQVDDYKSEIYGTLVKIDNPVPPTPTPIVTTREVNPPEHPSLM